MRDLNDDDDRLRSLNARPLSGLGKLLPVPGASSEQDNGPTDMPDYGVIDQGSSGSEPVITYSEPTSQEPAGGVVLADQGGAPTTTSTTPVVVTDAAPTVSLPQFNFGTGVASCTTCASEDASTSNAVPTKPTGTTVTPLPAGPATTNWLLLAAVAGVAWFCLKSPASGLGCIEEPTSPPAPPTAPALSGAPPRPRKPVAKHVASLKIS